MSQILAVGLGGFLGSILRFGLIGVFKGAPLGTLLVNLLGAFLIGTVVGIVSKENVTAYSFLTIGILGGFTTFSAVSLESIKLYSEGNYLFLSIYLLITVVGGIALCGIGLRITS